MCITAHQDRHGGLDLQDGCVGGDALVDGCVFGNVFWGGSEPGAEDDEVTGGWPGWGVEGDSGGEGSEGRE